MEIQRRYVKRSTKFYTMNLDSQLPYALRLAAGATQLDNIKVEIVDAIPAKKTFFFLKIGKWEKRMIDYCISKLNEDIQNSLIHYDNPKFYTPDRGLIIVRQNPIFAIINLHYKIK